MTRQIPDVAQKTIPPGSPFNGTSNTLIWRATAQTGPAMGEIVIEHPQSIPALPSNETTFDVPGPLRSWFSTGAPHAGLILALSPLGLLVAFFLMVAVIETTNIIALLGLFFVLLFAVFTVMLLSIATLVGRRTRTRRVRDAHQRYTPRLQSAKDWYVRGDITEAEYEQIRALVEPATTEKTPAIAADTAASTIRSFALMLSIVAALLVPFNMIVILETVFESEPDGLIILFSFVVVDAVTVFLIINGWRTAKVAATAATALQAQLTKRIEDHETEILKAARARRVGGASAANAPYASRPSFRAYGR